MKLSVKIILFGLLMLGTITAQGQIRDFLFGHFKEKKSITYGLNNRRTRIFQDRSTIYGAYIGIKFGERLKHVVTLNSTVLWVGSNDIDFVQPTEVQLNFVGFSEEFEFWKKGRWSLSTYLHGGFGRAHARPVSAPANNDLFATQWVIPTEAGIHGEFSVNEWLSFRGGAGYRYVFNKEKWPLHGMYFKVGAGVNVKRLIMSVNDLRRTSKKVLFRSNL